MGKENRKKIYLLVFLGLILIGGFVRFNVSLYLITEKEFVGVETIVITRTTFGVEGNSPDVGLEECSINTEDSEFERIQSLLTTIKCKRVIKSNIDNDFWEIYRVYLSKEDVIKIYDNGVIDFRDRFYIAAGNGIDNVLDKLKSIF